MTTSSTADALNAHGAALVALVGVLREAHDHQWTTPPRSLRSRLEEAQPSGRISDPTTAIALDERRLALRAAVLGAEHALATASGSFDDAREALELAVTPYRGEDTEAVLAALGVETVAA